MYKKGGGTSTTGYKSCGVPGNLKGETQTAKFACVIKASRGEQLDENTDDELRRIRRSSYHPDPARITEIPKDDGNSRLVAISSAAKPINNLEAIESKKTRKMEEV